MVIPVYRRAHLILRAADSVLKQTYRPIELVIVDDGSTDNTVEVVRRWVDTLPPDTGFSVKLLEQPNRGAQAARNHGLSASTGQFIQFLDSDDELLPQKIATQVAALQQSAALDMVYSPIQFLAQDGSPMEITGRPIGPTDNPQRHVFRILWHTCGPLYRAEGVARIGPWDTRLAAGQDWEYAARAKAIGLRMRFIPGLGGYAHRHGATRISTMHHRRWQKNMALARLRISRLCRQVRVRERRCWKDAQRNLFKSALACGELGERRLHDLCLAAAMQCPGWRRLLLWHYRALELLIGQPSAAHWTGRMRAWRKRIIAKAAAVFRSAASASAKDQPADD